MINNKFIDFWIKQFFFLTFFPYFVYFAEEIDFLIFSKTFLMKKKPELLVNSDCLTNSSFFSIFKKCVKAQSNFITFSKVIVITNDDEDDRQTDTFVKNRFFWLRGSQNVKIWWKFQKSFFTLNQFLFI